LVIILSSQSPAGQDVSPPPTFADFLADVRAEALSKGISEATLDLALADLTPEPVVVARDRAQPEQTLSLDAYVARRVGARMQATGRAKLAAYHDLLTRVGAAYGVAPAIVVAVWGLESNYGQFTGTYSTIRALATLAYDGRRPLFRRELISALEIVNRGTVTAGTLRGSWAGAMGQPQFMPSTFLERAVDFDGDGRPDIWTSEPDVLASMANYLRQSGWTADQRWGREVQISRAAMARIDRDVPMRTEGCRALRAMTAARPLSDWRALGVTLPGGAALPNADVAASLVRGERRHFLVYKNYDALLDYNCSNAYAISVGVLADGISTR